MTDETKLVGCKIPSEKHELLRKLAHERHSSVSDLLREEIDGLLAEADELDVEEVAPHDA